MKADAPPGTERRYPLIDVGLDLASVLVAELGKEGAPREINLLRGGHVNTNYRLRLGSGSSVVLRIYAAGVAAYMKEVRALRALAGALPVPQVHLADLKPRVFPYPYAVLEWIEGAPLDKMLQADAREAPKIGAALAALLLQMRRNDLNLPPRAPIIAYVRSCVYERGAAFRLGAHDAAELCRVVEENAADLGETTSLVHGDFQGDNILVRKKAGTWEVAGILDWEFAHTGSYLEDLGSLLRHEGEAEADFQEGLEVEFAQQGAPLPHDWRMKARICDMAAQCEKLVGGDRGEVTRRSIRVIQRCLQEHVK